MSAAIYKSSRHFKPDFENMIENGDEKFWEPVISASSHTTNLRKDNIRMLPSKGSKP